jgi:hypothetical protein
MPAAHINQSWQAEPLLIEIFVTCGGAAMLKFILGVVFGAVMSFVYVHYDIQLPSYLQMPDVLRGNLVATATEATLYDLDADNAAQQRALEMYFENRARDAVKVDTAFGHPFLTALHRERATRKARQLSMVWHAFGETLSKEALRSTLEKKYGTSDTDGLKRAMLMDALDRKPFLKRWLEKTSGPVTAENLRDLLKSASAYPAVLKEKDE